MEDVEEGFEVGGELLKDVKFTDDQRMGAQTEKRLETIMDALSKTGKEYDIKINFKKTKVMRVSGTGSKSTKEIDKKLLKYGDGAIWKISAGKIT